MNLEVESSLAAWLRSQAAFDGVAVHTGQNNEEIPGDQPVLIVSCDNAESPVSGLYRATVNLTLSTPVVVDGSMDLHRSLASSLRAAGSLAGVASFFPSSLVFSGSHLSSVAEARENDRLHTTCEIILGVREI